MTSRESGQFYAHARDLRRIEKVLENFATTLREDAKESAEREVTRAREEGKLLKDVEHVQEEIRTLRKRFEDHMGEHHYVAVTDTGPGAPRGEIAEARKDALEAQTRERDARTQLWLKIAALVGAGGLGVAVKALLG